MRSILETCQVRPDIISGTFNPEIFTASLSQVMDACRGKPVVTHALYTDAENFFRDATYPTEGLRMVLGDVFGRLSGDNSRPAIHRLETAFGGGKTHILIALTHLAHRGGELADLVGGIIPDLDLASPGEVAIAGVAGDEIPVRKPKGTALIPYTLWGEVAYQIGGESLYREVEADANSYSAPARDFLDKVLGGRKVLLLFDELAQYATRLEAAIANGGEQLAAFLMSLSGYARTHAGTVVVVSLAGQADAFATQTRRLKDLITQIKGEEISEQEAIGLAQKAEQGARSVLARDAVTVVPVQAAEISRVLAKRLFDRIDENAALETAAAYVEMYAKSGASLPDQAARADFRDQLVANYPFHPTFINFLNSKLSTVETFQGTRGVLRVLALALRTIWAKKRNLPMIHTCHLDLRDARTVNEILGRTGGGDLLPVLNADVGGADTSSLAGGKSIAQEADLANPHPAGHPMHEYACKTVFLHSLVGRAEGLGSNLFGITEKEALFETSFPEMTPPQVEAALKRIDDTALYVRFSQGRYYASLDPSENRTLATIRNGLRKDQVEEILVATARKVVEKRGAIQVVNDVYGPENVPDKKNQPQLGLIALDAKDIDADAFLTTCGENRPRLQQNLVFLMVPESVHVKGDFWNEDRVIKANETENRLDDLARWVLAMRRLKNKPENYGITAAKLAERNFDQKVKERELALITTVTQTYNSLWFSSVNGQVTRKEIKPGVGEGGASVIEEVMRVLRTEGKLVTTEIAATQETLLSLGKIFFESTQTPTLAKLRENFFSNRKWPVLEKPDVFEVIIRAGVTKGLWCLFRMAGSESTKPDEIFSRESGDLPFELDLTATDWSIVTEQGAKQRNWIGKVIDPVKVEKWVASYFSETPVQTPTLLVKDLAGNYGAVPENAVLETLDKQVRSGRLMTYTGDPQQEEKPTTLIYGSSAILHKIKPTDVVITPAEAAMRGWVKPTKNQLVLQGKAGAEALNPLLPRLGSLYARGAKSTIKAMDLVDLAVEGGGRLRVSLEDVPPDAMKRLGEFFEVLATVGKFGAQTDGYLEISNPDEECLLVKALKEGKEK